jgi:hypothetical protein
MENLTEIIEEAMKLNMNDIAPNFKKGKMTDEEVNRIINMISQELKISKSRLLVGIFLLFLKGAANVGTPATMSVELGDNKTLTKKILLNAYQYVTQNTFLRRLAEHLAPAIGKFAEDNKLMGELANRINNKHKADTGDSLDPKELAYCSSFSQSIPNLEEITSKRLTQLLAEDYNRRFEPKKTTNQNNTKQTNKDK